MPPCLLPEDRRCGGSSAGLVRGRFAIGCGRRRRAGAVAPLGMWSGSPGLTGSQVYRDWVGCRKSEHPESARSLRSARWSSRAPLRGAGSGAPRAGLWPWEAPPGAPAPSQPLAAADLTGSTVMPAVPLSPGGYEPSTADDGLQSGGRPEQARAQNDGSCAFAPTTNQWSLAPESDARFVGLARSILRYRQEHHERCRSAR